MRSTVALVCLALVLAGCDRPPSLSDRDAAPSAAYDEDSGGIEGLVVDPELVPIEGARIVIIGTNASVNTTSEGRFAISNLVPQQYLAIITKAGFREKKTGFDVPFGNVTRVRVILDPIPPPLPFIDQASTYARTIRFGYSYQVGGLQSNSSGQTSTLVPVQYRSDTLPALRFEKNWQTILLEVDWRPTSDQSDQLALQVGWTQKTSTGGTTTTREWVAGGDPGLRWRLERPTYDAMVEANKNLHPALSAGLPIAVTPATDPAQPLDVGFYAEQPYKVYLSIGYNGPIAANHTRLPPP